MGDCVKSLAEVEADNIHCSLQIHFAISFSLPPVTDIIPLMTIQTN